VGDTICAMIGIGGQFDNSSPFFEGHQIFPSSFSDLTICRAAPPTVIPFYPIGTINTEDSLGVADSLNVICQTSGTVTGVNRRGGGYEFALIDQSSGVQEGITVFEFNNLPNYTNPTEGDSILVYGRVDQFNGLIQFRPDSIMLISSGASITAPDTVNNLSEATESKLLFMENFVLLDSSISGSYNMRAVNGTDTITIRVDSETDVDDSLNLASKRLLVGDTVCAMIGIGGQFDNSSPLLGDYQIFPSRYADLTICRLLVGIDEFEIEEKEAELSIYPNPTTGDFTIATTTGFESAAVRLIIRDLSGRVIRQENILNANNSFQKSFNLSDEAKGIYFISIIDGANRINKKLIVH